MKSRRANRLRGQTACVILQQQCRTYRTTDLVPMPALASLSLLSTTLSGVVQTAGLVVDALHTAKSNSIVRARGAGSKSPPPQTIDANQLANSFAAYLAAAAHAGLIPITVSVSSTNTVHKAAASNTTAKSSTTKLASQQNMGTRTAAGIGKSVSLAPLTAMVAAGPTTALTAAMASHSASVSNKLPISGMVRAATVTHPVTRATVSLVASSSHTTAAQPAAAIVKTSTQTKGFDLPHGASTPSVSHPTQMHPTPPAATAPHSPAAHATTDTPNVTRPIVRKSPPEVVQPSLPTKGTSGIAHAGASPRIASPSVKATQQPPAPRGIQSPELPTRATASTQASAGSGGILQRSPGTVSLPQRSLGTVSLPQRSLESVTTPTQQSTPASQDLTTTQTPVTPRYVVPASGGLDSSQPIIVANASQGAERLATAGSSSSHQPTGDDHQPTDEAPRAATSDHSATETPHQPAEASRLAVGNPLVVEGTLEKFARSAMQTRPAENALTQKPTNPGSDEDSQQQPGSLQTALLPIAPSTTAAVGAPNLAVGNQIPSEMSAAQVNVSPSEQLSRAFVAQAATVNHNGRTDFHLNLQPPHLGRVHILLTTTDHTVTARVTVAQEGTRQLIAGQAHQLRQSLADSGLVLGNFDVMRDGNSSFAGGHHPPPELPPPPASTRNKSSTATPTAVVRTSPLAPTSGINVLA